MSLNSVMPFDRVFEGSVAYTCVKRDKYGQRVVSKYIHHSEQDATGDAALAVLQALFAPKYELCATFPMEQLKERVQRKPF